MRLLLVLLILCFVTLTMFSCAPGPNSVANTSDQEGHVAGFWLGLWQGMISPITWFISLFSNSVSFYEVHNNGGWYNFGFVLGAGILFGGGASANKNSN